MNSEFIKNIKIFTAIAGAIVGTLGTFLLPIVFGSIKVVAVTVPIGIVSGAYLKTHTSGIDW